MKVTTLRTGALTLDAVKYKFNVDGYLMIELTTDGVHKLYGNVNITLNNTKATNIYDLNGNLFEDFFNDTFSFVATETTKLIYSQKIKSGVVQSESFITLADNGSSITATAANSSFDLPAGTYNFNLLDTADSTFSTSTLSVKRLNVGVTGIDGLESVFDGVGTGEYPCINGQDLTFLDTARVSLKNNNSGVTNIPLVVYGL